MLRNLFIFFFSISFLVFISCERNQRDVGGVKKPLSSPSYEQLASISSSPSKPLALGGVQEGAAASIDANALFAQHCSACHQINGQGVPGAFPPLDKSPYVTGDNVERLASIMIYGLVGPINVLGTTYNAAMAPLGNAMNDEELAAVATYIRSSWSNKSGEVKKEVFSESRKKWGSRGMFNIKELGEES